MKKQILAAVFTLTVLPLLAQVSCGNHFPVFSPDGNYLYFTTNRDGQYELYRTAPDGSEITRITNNDIDEVFPKFSPDGSKIVFQGGFYGSESEIYVMNADGSDLTQLTDNLVHDGSPSFSPDGQKILFEGWDDYNYPEIFVMDADGSNRTQLTSVPGADWQSNPVYAPDGSSIYFLKGFNADNHYVKMDLDGSNWVDITEPNVFGYSEAGLSFNSDGSKIVFYTSEWGGYNGRTEIVIADADGSDWVRITDTDPNNVYNTSPVFNPTDDLIYFVSNQNDNNWHIFNMAIDGDNTTQLTDCSSARISDSRQEGLNATCIPNPVENLGYINISIQRPTAARARFTDVTGSSVPMKHYLSRAGVHLDRTGLPSGVYLFEVFEGKERLAYGKIVLQ